MTDTKHDKGRARKIRVNALLEQADALELESARPSGSMSKRSRLIRWAWQIARSSHSRHARAKMTVTLGEHWSRRA